MAVLTFASVSYLTGFILSGLCAFFLLARREKLETTQHLGWVFLYCALLQFSFLVGTSVYHPLSFLHRWVALPSAFLVFAHLSLYFFLLNPQATIRTGRILLGVGYLLALSVLILHIVGTIFSRPVYDFSGGVFDVIRRTDEKIIAWIGIVYLFSTLCFGVWRSFEAHRLDVRLMALSVWVPFLLLLGTTILYHFKEIAFPIDRAIALSFWNPIFLVALFLAWFVHLRASGEAFSLRAPILLGIILLLLFVFQGSSWLFIQPGLESFGDTVRERLKAQDLSSDSYSLTAQNNDGFILSASGGLEPSLFTESRKELILSFIWENPSSISKEYPAYSKVAESWKNSEKYSENLMDFSKSLEKVRKKIRNLPEKGIRAWILDVLNSEGKDEKLAQFMRILSESVKNSSAEGEALRALVLEQMRELVQDGEPRFRRITGIGSEEYYYSIIHKSPGKTQTKEIGIPYGEYLAFETGLLKKPLIAFLLCLLLFSIAANAFFSFFLLHPLERLYSGLELATEGDLQRELHPEAWDEIGSLADQFNRMIQSIRSGSDQEAWHTTELDPRNGSRSSWKEIANKMKYTSSPQELRRMLIDLQNQSEPHPIRSKLILKLGLKIRDYKTAYLAAQELRSMGVVKDPEMLFILSYCAKKIGDLQEAIRLAEEVRSILPQHIQNKLHLAEMYYHANRLSEAQELAIEIRREQGSSPAVTKLLNAIEKKGV
ncbi:HAMP domain-containing protein [Leptospira langatensis]|uniref:HAMP domain-containing protein n=1 Tax=Leptospira langatensis TaxID=2484983 RepID=A0A5F1ZVM5_9LEPT|nr:tetratricopeptide repeat protein [Leptospira langatensis]TGK02883.1 HAMP domain-containing protein [Leptospira langatensis]TGL41637.1 HAMP domain-containing protein [Leptospira langatensis]